MPGIPKTWTTAGVRSQADAEVRRERGCDGVEVLEQLMRDRGAVPVRHETFAGEFVPGTTLAQV
jgi:hypothetical protein